MGERRSDSDEPIHTSSAESRCSSRDSSAGLRAGARHDEAQTRAAELAHSASVTDGEEDRPGISPGPPLKGVRVLAEGKHVATSDADGLALLALGRQPAELEFVLPGWRVASSDTEDAIRRVRMIQQ